MPTISALHPPSLRLLLTAIGLVTVLAIGCGNDGDGGPDAATIGDANAPDLGVAAASASASVVKGEDLPNIPTPLPALGDTALAAEAARVEAEDAGVRAAMTPSPGLGDPLCPFGGSSSTSIQGTTTTTTYVQCQPAEGVTFDGAIIVAVTLGRDSFTSRTEYDQFCVMIEGAIGGAPQCYDGQATTIRCTGIQEPETSECTFSTSAEGLDGRTYEITNPTLEGNDLTGYLVSAEVEDPDWGIIGFDTTEPISFECVNGASSAGSIDYFGAGDTSATIDFLDCDTFDICFRDVCMSYDWSDYGLDPEPVF